MLRSNENDGFPWTTGAKNAVTGNVFGRPHLVEKKLWKSLQ